MTDVMVEPKPMVTREPVRLTADPRRVIARLFVPGGQSRVNGLLERVLAMSDAASAAVFERTIARYASRHRSINEVYDRHFAAVASGLNGRAPASQDRRRLIGAYFTSEYSLEAVALFNPSIVVHPDQSGVPDGSVRFIMSLRACGEGHISSIVFRTGLIHAGSGISFDAVSPYAASERPVADHLHDKNRFFLKLGEIGAYRPLADRVFAQLSDEFTVQELEHALDLSRRNCRYMDTYKDMSEAMLWLVRSSYRLAFPVDSDIAERVIFPVTENESRGIEDARFVRFRYDDGRIVYYATCTAYNGFRALPQFIETTDFRRFHVDTINGRCAQNKGMALFPRKIADRFVMMSRLDGENLFLLRSDDLHFWNEAQRMHGPTQPWELVQIGNCGSPIETDEGWLLLTHGVGPMREYWMGAVLLDLEDPSRVIGHLPDPILMPNDEERDGYVPNVVYSCGGLVLGDSLVIPYGISDTSTGVARISVSQLLSRLVRT